MTSPNVPTLIESPIIKIRLAGGFKITLGDPISSFAAATKPVRESHITPTENKRFTLVRDMALRYCPLKFAKSWASRL